MTVIEKVNRMLELELELAKKNFDFDAVEFARCHANGYVMALWDNGLIKYEDYVEMLSLIDHKFEELSAEICNNIM